MKTIYCTDTTALELMRVGAVPRPSDAAVLLMDSLKEPATSARDIKALLAESPILRALSKPLNILVPAASLRRSSKLIAAHAVPTALATLPVVSVDHTCKCVAPELLYAVMGRNLSAPERVKLAMELCGSYAMPAAHGNEAFTRYGLEPLTTTSAIKLFLDENPKLYGALPAQTALAYAADRSASPMETALYVMLCLPSDLGGYGLPKPTLNAKLDVASYLKDQRPSETVYGDLFFENCNVILEYQSRMFHESAIDQDEDRRDDIEAAGYTVMFVSPSRLQDFKRFEALVLRLAHHMGIHPDTLTLGPTEQRLALRKMLYPASWTARDSLLV